MRLIWVVGVPREVIVEPPAKAMTDGSDWVVAQLDSNSQRQIFIPLKAGKLQLPKFFINQQVANPHPKFVQIMAPSFPPFIPV